MEGAEDNPGGGESALRVHDVPQSREARRRILDPRAQDARLDDRPFLKRVSNVTLCIDLLRPRLVQPGRGSDL